MELAKPSWKQPRFLADLTPHQSQALVRCHALAILVVQKRDDPGGPAKHGIAPRTLNTLVDGGLIEEGRDKRARRVWKPTAVGLAIIAAEQPRFLSRAADHMDPGSDTPGYTISPAKAMFPDAGEAPDAATLERYSQDAHARHIGAPGHREEELRRRARSLATRLKQGSIAAGRAGVDVADVSAQLDQIETHLAELERLRAAA